MGRVTDEVEVRAAVSAERVFAVLTDWPRHGEWMPFTRATGGEGVGAVIEGWTGLGPVGFLDTMRISEWEPGRRVAVVHTGRLVRGEGWFTTTPLPGGGCAVRWGESLDPPVPAALWRLAAPVYRAFMRRGLTRLVRLAEAA
ncbi:polyketide cyclase/dehydrase/lipid transport protein [Actinocorallia herbida]|uniref:Polyketide cyclase/dehydrase/lipid transport protein n=1 Tax=Actinocorallia herbida TaxID=58109 RepID=A0A3N1D9P6_9ACTN|nr:SRPBCC family protein [Actinocorallia herbida]ROO90257.1 polyketide cyclase/dehydrase/lipid transport protein [Actinocorallia herbida]